MPCIPLPKLPLPTIPAGLTITAPFPAIPEQTLQAPCCLLPPIKIPGIPNPLGPLVVNPAFVEVIRAGLAAIEAYDDLIPLDCPRS